MLRDSRTRARKLTMAPQSAHPAVLFCLYFFRTAAIAVYILCGFFISNYVLSVSPSPHYKSSSMLKAFMSIR